MSIAFKCFYKLTAFLPLFLLNSLLVAGLRGPALSAKASPQEDIFWVNYCDLTSSPAKYDRKIIATQAILVETIVPHLDGGGSFVYSPKCNREDYGTVVNTLDLTTLSEFEELEPLLKKAVGKKEVIRVKVLLVGKYFAPKLRGGYGHLDWARDKIEVSKIEAADYVEEDLPWPKGYEKPK